MTIELISRTKIKYLVYFSTIGLNRLQEFNDF